RWNKACALRSAKVAVRLARAWFLKSLHKRRADFGPRITYTKGRRRNPAAFRVRGGGSISRTGEVAPHNWVTNVSFSVLSPANDKTRLLELSVPRRSVT
ncbi:MAG: outer membrane protein TolC, partial [Ascidiaceihabitans sp.]